MKDYYAILGLDPDASKDSIRVAYRRLAREFHPDRVRGQGKEELEQASAKMAELNEAYSVLSNTAQRNQYDSEWRKVFAPQQAAAEELATAMEAIKAEQEKVAAQRARAKPVGAVRESVVRQYSAQVLKDLLANKKTFTWQSVKFEGFDWALECTFFLSRYWTVLRTFPIVDRAAVEKFNNYASLGIDKHKSWYQRNFFLFLIAFQRMNDPNQVTSLFRRFLSSSHGKPTLQPTSVQVVLLDAGQGRAILCGPDLKDQRFNQLLLQLRTRGG